MPFASVNGIKLYYEVHGTAGPPLVFAHGGGADMTQWDPQVEFFSRQFQVITYDSRGHGHSGVPAEGYSVEIFTEDLSALLRHLAVPRACIIGLSMGGMVAMNLALRHPEAVAALVLVSTAAEVNEVTRQNFEQSAQIALEIGMEAFAHGFCNVVFSEAFKRLKPELTGFCRKRIARTSPLGYANSIRALAAQEPLISSLAQIEIPALVVTGQIETLPHSLAYATAIRQAIPGAELAIIAEAAYLTGLEQPERFNEAVLNFLRRVEFNEEVSDDAESTHSCSG